MLALSLESAKTLAIVVAAVFVVFAVASAWMIKNITTKIIAVVLLAGLALGVWTQRTSLQDCADKAKQRGIQEGEITCTFFGTEIAVPSA